MADKRPTKTKLPETKIDLELPTSKGELVPYKKPEGGLSDTPQGKRARRNIVKGRGSAKRRALSALLELLVGTAVTEEPSISASIEERMNPDPQRVYHGTTLPLESRESPEWYPKYGEEIQALGEWFTEDPQVASHFAHGEKGTVYPSYLNIKRPKVYETYEDLEEDLYSSELGSEDFRKKLQEEGYDGIEITLADTDVLLGSGRPIERRDFVAFEPKQIISSISPNQEKGLSELPVFHGGAEHPNFETELYFVSPSASQAKEYGKEHGLTSVFQYTVDPNKIADEDIARSVIKKLGITPKGGWTVDDSLLFEMIDPNFDQYIGKKNVSKLIKEMKKDGFIGIKYLDEDMVSGRKAGIANIVLFEIPKLKGKSSGGLVGLI